MTSSKFPPEESPTGVVCLACGGEGKRVYEKPNGSYATHVCAHCTEGVMSPVQQLAWKQAQTARQRGS